MKKLFVLFIAAMCLWTDGMCLESSSGKGLSSQDVKIVITDIKGSRPRPRTAQPLIEAEADVLAGQLLLYFNYEMGKVAIDVINSMGMVVSHYSCDTDMEPMAVMNIPTDADNYTITITGPNVEAYGNYAIPAN